MFYYWYAFNHINLKFNPTNSKTDMPYYWVLLQKTVYCRNKFTSRCVVWVSRFHNGIIKIPEASRIRLSPLYQNTNTCLHQQFNFFHSHQPIQIVHICISKHISVLIYQYKWTCTCNYHITRFTVFTNLLIFLSDKIFTLCSTLY